MALKSKNWLQRPNVTWQWAALAVAAWSLGLILLDQTELAKDLEDEVARPMDFRVRDALDRSPKLDKRIKVFGIDDSTVSWLGSASPTIEQWVSVIEGFASRKPKAIIIDGMFSSAVIPKGEEESAMQAIRRLEKLDTPVVVGAFVSKKKLRHREPLSLASTNYDLARLITRSANDRRSPAQIAEQIDFSSADSPYVYGPEPKLRKAFRQIGHIHYSSDSRLAPYYRMEKSMTVVPHFMLLLDPKPKFDDKILRIRGHDVFRYRDGTIPLNFTNYGAYLSVTKPLRPYFNSNQRVELLKNIGPEDYVYILPYFYTGNTDFKMTPFGSMPAGYVHLALLNSILTGEWLKPLWAKEVMMILFAVIGAAVAVRCGPVLIGVSIIGGIAAWLLLVNFLFSYHGVVLPWILPTVAYAGALLTVFVEKTRMAEKKSQFIRHALDGVISPKTLKALAKNPENLNFEARERVVTITFIDVVGFSLMAENQLPRIAFDQLKAIMGDIIRTVHEHGGIVNKNLGDGLLCFFGYSLETDESTFDHAEKAFECAVQIQRENLPKTLQAFERGDPVYPLRIGINTSSVFLGNIGTEDRLDFTIVGNGVNFAKRLEAACETHSILMSNTTRELIDPMGNKKAGLKKQYIQIKHHSEMVEAYSYDPFHGESGLKEKAIEAHISSTNLARIEERWSVRDPHSIMVNTQVGQGFLTHFSQHNLNVILPTLLVNHAILKLRLDSPDRELGEVLRESGIEWLECEVMWSYEEAKGYLHGLKIRGMRDQSAVMLLDVLKDFTQQDTSISQRLDRLTG